MFLGEFEHTVDDRGRLAIPAHYRTDLASGMFVTRGFERCLIIWPEDEWRSLADRLGQLSVMHSEARQLQRFLFSGATDVMPDRLGRIVVPAFLRRYAEIDAAAVLVGVNTRVEVWSQPNWQRQRATNEENSASLAEHLFQMLQR